MKIYSIDKIQEGIATVVCDDDRVLNVPENILLGMRERDVFSADEVNGRLTKITPMPEETQRRMEYARSILNKFKSKKQKTD